jgi:hypothetical protein
MTTTTVLPERAAARLDFTMLRRGSLYFAVLGVVVAPFVPDPICYAGGAIVPWVLLSLIGYPTMPKALVFFLLWQWAQIFAREILAILDGESMAIGVYGNDLLRAYWYGMAGLITFALTFRLMLGKLRPPTVQEYYGHERWRATDLILVYLVAAVGSVALAFIARAIPSLDQPFSAAAQIKVVALFLLCTYVFTTGQGGGTLLAAVVLEIFVGFTGFFSDFRGVFVYVAFAALAARLKWSGTATVAAISWLAVLLGLALFWTSVKVDYREYASGGTETQAIVVPLSERMGYLGDKVLSIGETNWGETAYTLLYRFAYVDIFAQVIGVADSSPEPMVARQWREALGHVFQPRFLFPDKAGLSDSDVYLRLMRADPFEQINRGTSISVGYMGEMYSDLGFPGMLAGIVVAGVLIALIAKYFMSRPLPWMLREGIVMGLAYMTAGTGMEISLPKLLGTLVMYFLVWSLIAKFALPVAMRWLDARSVRSRRLARS